MLRLQQLLRSIRHAQLVGERPYGHFDHEAKANSGPPSQERLEDLPTAADVGDPYEPRVHSATGEMFYVKKRSTTTE